MSDYHTQAAMDVRLKKRAENPVPLGNPQVFYHVACMGNWKDVVAEQTRLLAHVGLTEVVAGILGQYADVDGVKSIAAINGVRLEIGFTSTDLARHEEPTLSVMHSWARKNPDKHVIYHHTKGVAWPGHAQKAQWRKVMAYEVVGGWERNARVLEFADSCGVHWCMTHAPGLYWGFYPGNFWSARCDWLANLKPPTEYRELGRDLKWWGQLWRNRYYCETWIGSENAMHIESFHHGSVAMHTDGVFSLPTSTEGLVYGGVRQ